MSLDWLISHWSSILGDFGIIAGLFFSGLGFWTEARVRRAHTVVEITKQHRELWMHFDEHPELAGLFDSKSDMAARQLTSQEAHFVSFLLNHLRGTFYARSARTYIQPECLREDIRDFFSYPAPRAAWKKVKRYHDAKFVAFVEENLMGT